MPKVFATIQEGQFRDDQVVTLEQILRRNYAEHVGASRLTVIWCTIPAGQAFTHYQPSRSSIISMECNAGFPQDRREALLHACERDWIAVTGQSADHVMLSLIESSTFNEVVDGNRQRLSWTGNLRLQAHVLLSIVVSKVRRGYLGFQPNL